MAHFNAIVCTIPTPFDRQSNDINLELSNITLNTILELIDITLDV